MSRTNPPPDDPEEGQVDYAWIDRMRELPTRYLRPGEKLLLDKIARRKPNAPNKGRKIANKWLAADIGQCERNVRRLKIKVRRKGLIHYVDNEGGFVGGRGNTTTYYLRDPASWFRQAEKEDKLLPPGDPERGTSWAEKEDKLGRKGGQVGPERRTTQSATTSTSQPLTTARALPAHVGAPPVARAAPPTSPEAADRPQGETEQKPERGLTAAEITARYGDVRARVKPSANGSLTADNLALELAATTPKRAAGGE